MSEPKTKKQLVIDAVKENPGQDALFYAKAAGCNVTRIYQLHREGVIQIKIRRWSKSIKKKSIFGFIKKLFS